MQFSLFILISPFRNTPLFVGFSGRYYTIGLIPLLSAGAIGMSEFVRRKEFSVVWLVVPLILVTALNVNRNRVRYDHYPLVEYGRTARIDYYQTKLWLQRHRNEVLGDNFASQSVAPWLDVKMLLPVMGILDRTAVTVPLAIKPVTYVENTANTRPWGPVFTGHPAVQTFRLDRRRTLTKIELLTVRTGHFNGSASISLLDEDGGKVLWEIGIPSQVWPNDSWLGVPVDLIQLEPQRVYTYSSRLHLGQPFRDSNSLDERSRRVLSDGETRTPDGVRGDLCFRLSFIEP